MGLWKVAQDLPGRRPVVRVVADVRPDNAPGRINDKHGRCRHAVAQQVKHAVGICHGVICVGQDWKVSADSLGYRASACCILKGHGQDFGFARLELWID